MKSCQEIGQLLSESHDRKLSFLDRFAVRMHLLMCAMCRAFSKQLEIMHRIAAGIGRVEEIDEKTFDRSLSPDAKSRIAAALSREMP